MLFRAVTGHDFLLQKFNTKSSKNLSDIRFIKKALQTALFLFDCSGFTESAHPRFDRICTHILAEKLHGKYHIIMFQIEIYRKTVRALLGVYPRQHPSIRLPGQNPFPVFSKEMPFNWNSVNSALA